MKAGSSSLKESISLTKLERNVRSVHQEEKQLCCKPYLYESYIKVGIRRGLINATNKTAKSIGGYNLKYEVLISKKLAVSQYGIKFSRFHLNLIRKLTSYRCRFRVDIDCFTWLIVGLRADQQFFTFISLFGPFTFKLFRNSIMVFMALDTEFYLKQQ